jgi:hypothetical protein
MAGTQGTGTAGANQDGTTGSGFQTTLGARTPGEVLITGQDAAHSSASGPNISEDMRNLFVREAFDLAVKEPLRNALIFDQFATPKAANLTLSGWEKVTTFFGDDLPEEGADVPLLENLDVDSLPLTGRQVSFTAAEYGRAVSRTRLANAKSMVNIDPMIVSRVAFDAARGQDGLARKALLGGSADYLLSDKTSVAGKFGSIGTAATEDYDAATALGGATDTFLSTTVVQIAASMLAQQNCIPFGSGNFVLLTGPTGAQHIQNERDTGGFRYVTARNEGAAGNSIYRGQIGYCEGVDVVVANRMPNNMAILMAKDALAKVYTTKEGYAAQPQTVVAPVIDKQRRFLSWGWLHYVGFGVYDTRAAVIINYDNVWRPAGANNLGAGIADITPAVFDKAPAVTP